MSDIFDEVDEILNEVDGETTESQDLGIESNFNESELMDIMAEIENLEKEFITDEVISHVEQPEDEHKESLQEAIDRELAMSIEMSEAELTPKKISKTESVLAFEKKSISTIAPSPSSEISFEAHGQMNLNLGFKIGKDSASLTIDPVKGLTVTMNGVILCINEEAGCHVTMENGVTFTIPLTSSATNLKKKSA